MAREIFTSYASRDAAGRGGRSVEVKQAGHSPESTEMSGTPQVAYQSDGRADVCFSFRRGNLRWDACHAMKTLISVVAVVLSTSPHCWAQTGRATKGEETLPASGTARLYVTPMATTDKSLAGLIKAADVVIDGTVQLPARKASARNLETDIRIAVGSVLKGPLTNKEIMVSQMGEQLGI